MNKKQEKPCYLNPVSLLFNALPPHLHSLEYIFNLFGSSGWIAIPQLDSLIISHPSDPSSKLAIIGTPAAIIPSILLGRETLPIFFFNVTRETSAAVRR